jgi:hypothetical protein
VSFLRATCLDFLSNEQLYGWGVAALHADVCKSKLERGDQIERRMLSARGHQGDTSATWSTWNRQ